MSTVSNLLSSVSLCQHPAVGWGEPIACRGPGIYIVSLSSECDQNTRAMKHAPIDRDIVAEWLDRVPEFRLDGGRRPSPDAVAARLGEFWLPDESILYIGQTTRDLRKRVDQFNRHMLGNSGPHKGGQWLKTLSVLRETFVHYAESSDPKTTEDKLIEEFTRRVSESTRRLLRDNTRPFPFANLEYPKGTRKRHGMLKSTVRRTDGPTDRRSSYCHS